MRNYRECLQALLSGETLHCTTLDVRVSLDANGNQQSSDNRETVRFAVPEEWEIQTKKPVFKWQFLLKSIESPFWERVTEYRTTEQQREIKARECNQDIIYLQVEGTKKEFFE